MAEYETKELSGKAFKNRNRRNENDSNYTGECRIDGKLYWINVWVKKDKNDQPWFSYSFREKKPSGSSNPKQDDDVILSDEIPF